MVTMERPFFCKVVRFSVLNSQHLQPGSPTHWLLGNLNSRCTIFENIMIIIISCKSLEIVDDLDPCFRFYDDFWESLPFCKVGRLSLANSSSFIHWITIQMMMMMNTKGDCGCLYCGDLATCMVHTTQWLGQFCLQPDGHDDVDDAMIMLIVKILQPCES